MTMRRRACVIYGSLPRGESDRRGSGTGGDNDARLRIVHRPKHLRHRRATADSRRGHILGRVGHDCCERLTVRSKLGVRHGRFLRRLSILEHDHVSTPVDDASAELLNGTAGTRATIGSTVVSDLGGSITRSLGTYLTDDAAIFRDPPHRNHIGHDLSDRLPLPLSGVCPRSPNAQASLGSRQRSPSPPINAADAALRQAELADEAPSSRSAWRRADLRKRNGAAVVLAGISDDRGGVSTVEENRLTALH